MKKISSITFMLFAFVASISAQQIEKLFDKYQEDERFNYVYKKARTGHSRMEFNLGEYFQKAQNERMLILKSKDQDLRKSFLSEVETALLADKFENTSYIRNGKSNRVSKYLRERGTILDEVSFIDNGGNIIIKWEEYHIKKNKK